MVAVNRRTLLARVSGLIAKRSAWPTERPKA